MKVNFLTLLAATGLVLLSATARAEESAATALAADAKTAPVAPVQTAGAAPMAATRYDTATYYDDSDPVADFLVRAGAWGVHASGSPTQVGQYQNLDSSPETDFTGIWSNGTRSVDFDTQINDNETENARVHYFGPHLEADVQWEQFQHQLGEHDYAGWNFNGINNSVGPGYVEGAGTLGSGPTNPQNPRSIVLFSDNNMSPGTDYAINVQEFKANFHGNLTENLKWRLNVFGIDKEGLRQVNEFQHCSAAAGNGSTLPAPLPLGGVTYSGTTATPKASAANPTAGVPAVDGNLTSQCHVTTQAQHIDWQTTEVTPSLELRIDCDTFLEYSHTVRAFNANDQMSTFNYDASASWSINPTAVSAATSTALTPAARQAAINNLTAGYAIVPSSETQIDRLKFSTKIGCNTDAYLLGYAGYNEDELRDTYRDFNGADLRITNKSFDSLTVTGYGKYYREDTTSPLSPLSPYPVTGVPANNFYQEPYLGSGPQINREIHTIGLTARWRPFEDQCGTLASRLSFVGGYEYSTLMRENAGDTFVHVSPPANGPFVTNNVFNQPNSNTNTFTFGVEEKWSACFDTFLRYKFIGTDYAALRHYARRGATRRRLEQRLAHAGEPRGVGLHLDAQRLRAGECDALRGKRHERRALRRLDEQQPALHGQCLVGADAGLVVLGRGRRDG